MNQTLFRLTFLLAVVVITQNAIAQNSTTTDSTSKAKADSVYKVLFNRRGKSIYAELGGPGAAYSINYDTRFSKKMNGSGIRAGISYTPLSDQKALVVPVLFNHLLGHRSHFFESGAGVILYHYQSDNFHHFFSNHVVFPPDYYTGEKFYQEGQSYPEGRVTENGAIYTVTAGYRYQPLKGGLMIRAGAGPIFDSRRVLFWPYLSFGYTFKNKAKAKQKAN